MAITNVKFLSNFRIPIICLFISLLFIFKTTAQSVSDNGLRSSIEAFKDLGLRLPIEKLYLQFDKPVYFTGDTLRFKAYLFNADFLRPSTRSGLLYVELDDADNHMIKRIMVPVIGGLSAGDIALDGAELPEGNYIIRAYTNWMRNFGEDYIFSKSIYLAPVSKQTLLVSSSFKTGVAAEANKVSAELRFTDLEKRPLGQCEMQILVTLDKKNLYREQLWTDKNGSLSLNFLLPDDATDLTDLVIIAAETGKNSGHRQLKIPVLPERPQHSKLSFSAEGGRLVGGITTRIAFKASTESGKEIAVSGKIYNSTGQEITVFKSIDKGLGSFEFKPLANERYTAIADLPGGIKKSFPLPVVMASGTTFSVKDLAEDSLLLTFNITPDRAIGPSAKCYLIGEARGIICYAEVIDLSQNIRIDKILSKKMFPTGVCRFTILSSDRQVLNERLFYVDHQDNLQLRADAANKADSVVITLEAKDEVGKPIQGNFSLSVTAGKDLDRSSNHLPGYLLLASDLQDFSAGQEKYLDGDSILKPMIMDHLMQVEKGLGYSWEQALSNNKKLPVYEPEQRFTVRGRAVNFLNKPAVGLSIILLQKNTGAVLDTITDSNGVFVFEGLFPVDTAVFKLQAQNKNGKPTAVKFIMETFKAPVFTKKIPAQLPWYINSDPIVLSSLQSHIALRINNPLQDQARLLNEVVITGKKNVKGSKNLNGPGASDQTLDTKDLEKEGRTTLANLLEKHIKGFKIYGLWKPQPSAEYSYYMLYEKKIRFIINGVDLEDFYGPPALTGEAAQMVRDHYLFLKAYLDTYIAEDITGIEVMYSSRYASKYDSYHLERETGENPRLAYIEVTTRNGSPPSLSSVRGTYVYRTMPFSLPKRFYRADTGAGSTLMWVPNIVTDSAGKAGISFYNNNKDEHYTIVINGTDANGNSGHLKKDILNKY